MKNFYSIGKYKGIEIKKCTPISGEPTEYIFSSGGTETKTFGLNFCIMEIEHATKGGRHE